MTYAQRYGSPLSLVAFDSDHFKKINDLYGHEGGDNVLRALSRYFLEAVRDADQPVASMGGEEFALLLARAPLHFTSSLGVAQFRAEDADLNALMQSADRALYQAKERGGNRVEAHG